MENKKEKIEAFAKALQKIRKETFVEFLLAEHKNFQQKLAQAEHLKEYAKSRLTALVEENRSLSEKAEHAVQDMAHYRFQLKVTLDEMTTLRAELSEKNNQIAALLQDRVKASNRAERAEQVGESLDSVLEDLEMENSALRREFEWYKKKLEAYEASLKASRHESKELQKSLQDRTEAMVTIEQEKNRMIYLSNQETWMREQAEDIAKEIKQQKLDMEVARQIADEHIGSALIIAQKEWDKERKQYEQHLKNLRRLLQTRQFQTAS